MSHINPNLREIYMMDPGRPVDLLLSLHNHFVTICFIHPSKQGFVVYPKYLYCMLSARVKHL